VSFLPGCGRHESLSNTNVVILTIDTLRSDYLGAYGSEKRLTPFMDRLTKGGILFRNAIAPSSWTKPSVASLMTGLYARRHGTVLRRIRNSEERIKGRLSLDPKLNTLSERLKKAGYHTAAFITNPNVITSLFFDQGFDEFVQPAGDGEGLLEKALEWIRAEGKKGKFFLYLHLFDPHHPYFPPEEYRAKFVKGSPGEGAPFTSRGYFTEIVLWQKQYKQWRPSSPEDRFRFNYDAKFLEHLKNYPDLFSNLKPQAVESSVLDLDFNGREDPKLQRRISYLTSLYNGEVSYSDDAVQNFLAKLEEMEHLQKTILVVTADHGEAFLEHDQWGHCRSVHAEEVNIPLILRLPANLRPNERVIHEPVSLVDIYPTILDLIEISIPEDLDGVSLRPLIFESRRSFSRGCPVFTELIQENKDFVAAIVPGRKLIRQTNPVGKVNWSYYDIESDPQEEKSLVPDENDKRVRALKRSIMTFLKTSTLKFEKGDENTTLSEEEIERMRALGYF
jgi:arylsulfatase A-like enzyme